MEDFVYSSNVWIVLFIVEFIVIVISNVFIFLVFVKIYYLCKCSMYLIINLVVVDLLVGVLMVFILVLYFHKDED